jgi:polyhydroxyalkanoate synthase
MVGFLVDEGFDVYVLDWRPPRPADSENTLETYVDGYIPDALAAACARSGTDDATLVGYCLGGVLALLLAAAHPEAPVRNLITLTTPCDYAQMGFMSSMFLEGRLDPEDVIDETGMVPADILDLGFRSLRPTEPVVQQLAVLQNAWNDAWLSGFVAMNRWARDQVPFPGAAFRQIVETLIRDNALAAGIVPYGDGEIRLADIICPYLNVFCRRDEIVPPKAAEPLADLVGSPDATELCLPSGHIGLVAGQQSAKVARPKLAQWILERSDVSAQAVPESNGRPPAHATKEESGDESSARSTAR